MSTTIVKQIEPYSGNSHNDTYIVGTKIYLYYIESCIMGATKNDTIHVKVQLRQNKVADLLLAVYNQASEKE